MVDIERVRREAAKVQFGRTLLTIVASALYGFGWLLAKVVHFLLNLAALSLYGLGRALAWSYIAVRIGFEDGMKPKGRVGPA